MSANPSESDSSKLSHPPLLVDIRIFLVKKVNNSTSIFLVAFKIRVSLKYLVLLPTVLLKTCFLGKNCSTSRLHAPRWPPVWRESCARSYGAGDYKTGPSLLSNSAVEKCRVSFFIGTWYLQTPIFQFGHLNKMFRFPSPSTSKGWVGRMKNNNNQKIISK